MNEIICYGFLEKGTGKHQSNTIYSTGGVLPTQYAQQYKNPPMIVVIGSRTVLTQTTTKEQPLRTISKNTDGSSLSKLGIDEYHKRPRMVGFVFDNPKGYASGRGNVYDYEHISPTVLTAQGGGNKIFIVEHDDK